MKQNSKCKKIITIFLVTIIVFTMFTCNNNVYGKINTLYGENDLQSTQIDVDKASSDSVILEGIAYLVYAIAGFIEIVIRWIMNIFTGTDVFPWADKVIFNTIAFLDVNFLNAEYGSMFLSASGETTIFGSIIQKMYYTIFTLTVAFFGVVVGIMALRLAISSIASEKAKYKEAITNWLLALILIFTSHYLMAFIFFINEKMVEVATSIVTNSISEENMEIALDTNSLTDAECAYIVTSALYSAFEAGWGTDEQDADVYVNYSGVILGGNFTLTEGSKADTYNISAGITYMNYPGATQKQADDGKAWQIPNGDYRNFYNLFVRSMARLLMDREYMSQYGWTIDYEQLSNDMYEALDGFGWDERILGNAGAALDTILTSFDVTGQLIFDVATDNTEDDMENIIDDALMLALLNQEVISDLNSSLGLDLDGSNTTSVKNNFRYTTMHKAFWEPTNDLYINDRDKWEQDNADLIGTTPLVEGDILGGKISYEFISRKWSVIPNDIIDVHATATASSVEEIFAGLGEYFKNLVYGVYTNNEGEMVGYKLSEFNFIPAILYAIFVIQSLMYFISYLRRFFYVIVLALFAPIIVVYDFLMKSAS